MLRRIVLIRPHEFLAEAWQKRAFSFAAQGLEQQMKVRGLQFLGETHPVPAFKPGGALKRERGTKIRYRAQRQTEKDAYAVVSMFEDQSAVERLKKDRANQVVGVFADPQIKGCPGAYCNAGAVGTFQDVRRLLGVPKLTQKKLTGKDIRIAIVDTGIHGANLDPDGKPLQRRIDPKQFYSPRSGYAPGSNKVDHATMVAFDCSLAAPDSTLLDYALLQSTRGDWGGFISDALAAFADLIDLLQRSPGPLVANNSWGLFDSSQDEPVGSPGNYSENPNHPFNQITGALVAAGADVVFAAGNCGAECPDGRCGASDTGPGHSIHGANSHPAVITVAAVTVKGERLGYSSQGPGGLDQHKPDLAAYSHFEGSGVYPADSGTSAASPVATGVVAALRQVRPDLAPAVLKGILQKTCGPPNAQWNYDLGYGILNAAKGLAGTSGETVATSKAMTPATKKTRSAWGPAWMFTPPAVSLQTPVRKTPKSRTSRRA